ncbi:MAG TPA: response regulator transcription factor [Candidatus Obscuribacterales bacterium]
MPKILLVEDDAKLANMVRNWLKSQLHIVDATASGEEALEMLHRYPYDLVILDLMLPDLSGLDVCRKYRDAGGKTLILMLTGKQTVSDRETGLDAGADDYLTKPFDVRELSARVRALLRRNPGLLASDTIKIGELELDAKARTVLKSGKQLDLAPKEFLLLEFLMRNPNQVFSTEALFDRVWKTDSNSSLDTVRVYVSRVRNKIGEEIDSPRLETLHGIGYKLVVKDS